MKNDSEKFPWFPKLIATSFGLGYWPWGPGTMGAIGGLGVWLLCLALCPSAMSLLITTLILIVIFTWLGVWSGTISERYWGEDPSKAVMDETVGQWINMVPLCVFGGQPDMWHNSAMWIGVVVSLILFRFFDIAKPLGIRACERLRGGWGIMADDVVAGIYGAVILYFILKFL